LVVSQSVGAGLACGL